MRIKIRKQLRIEEVKAGKKKYGEREFVPICDVDNVGGAQKNRKKEKYYCPWYVCVSVASSSI